MTTILALDTSGDACSCALIHHNQLCHSFKIIPRQQAAQILPMICQLMRGAGLSFQDLDVVAYGQGPGSFTGLRIAAGITQGIAYAAQLPVVAVSTLAALAYQIKDLCPQREVLSVIDARIDEVYWGSFHIESSMPVLQGFEKLTAPELVGISPGMSDSKLAVVGTGLQYFSRFSSRLHIRIASQFPDELPAASAIARLGVELFNTGQLLDAAAVQPVYLRDQVARKPG